jgi:hypothetical protein
MESVGGKPRSPNCANAPSDIGEALQKLQSAVANLDDLEIHLNNAEGAHADDRDEISSAKSSANNLDDDLKAVKPALDPRSDRDDI